MIILVGIGVCFGLITKVLLKYGGEIVFLMLSDIFVIEVDIIDEAID